MTKDLNLVDLDGITKMMAKTLNDEFYDNFQDTRLSVISVVILLNGRNGAKWRVEKKKQQIKNEVSYFSTSKY